MALLTAIEEQGEQYIHKIPNEILHKIFIYYGADLLSKWRKTKMTAVKSLIIISSVCHRWRTASLALPRLWVAIQIISSSLSYASQLVPLLLERSQNAPLVANIHLCTPEDCESSEATAALVALFRHSNRIHSLAIGSFLPSTFQQFQNHSLSALSTLNVATLCDIPPSCYNALSHANLVSITTNSVISCSMHLPETIQHLKFQTCLDGGLVEKLPSLHSITFIRVPRAISQIEIVSSSVVSLKIMVDFQRSPYRLQQLFARLTFPSLSKLTIEDIVDEDPPSISIPWPREDFCLFLKECNLAFLTITSYMFEGLDLLAVLPELHAL